MMRRYLKFLVPVAFLAMAVAVLVLLYATRPKAERQAAEERLASVLVSPVEPQSLRIPVFTRGLVLPDSDLPVVSETSGPVTYISPNFVAGGYFRKGEVLLRVDDVETRLMIKKAEAVLAQATQALAQASAEARSMQSNPSAEIVRHHDQQARFQHEAAKADLAHLRQQQAKAELIAPFDGRVQSQTVNMGAYLKPGVPLGRIFAVNMAGVRLPLSNEQAALVDLASTRLGLSSEGPKATFYLNHDGTRYHWSGMVLGTEASVDEFNRQLYVVAKIMDPFSDDPAQPGRPPLTLGTFVDVEIEGREFEDVYAVQRRAFLNGSQLWIVDDKDRLQRREVDILYKGRDVIYVTKGLNAGDQVVLSHLKTAVDGLPVRPQLQSEQAAAEVNESMQRDVKQAVSQLSEGIQ